MHYLPMKQWNQNKVFTKLSTGQSDGLFLPICGNPGKSRGSRSRSCRHCVQVSWLRNTFQCGDKIYVCRAGGIVWFKHHWIQTSWTCSVVSYLLSWKPRIYRWKRLLLVASLFFTFDLSIDQNTEIMTKLQKDISWMYWHQIDLLQFELITIDNFIMTRPGCRHFLHIDYNILIGNKFVYNLTGQVWPKHWNSLPARRWLARLCRFSWSAW